MFSAAADHCSVSSKTARTRNRLILGFCLLLLATLTPYYLHSQTTQYSCLTGFGPEPPVRLNPALLMQSLKIVDNPIMPGGPNGLIRADLVDYIADQKAAVQLGKALFWEMQVGSDSKVACASCHWHAGGDARVKNQMQPGANGQWDGYAANGTLAATDFPFTSLTQDRDNIAGSQGQRNTKFYGFSKTGKELIDQVSDPVFTEFGKNTRQVTGKNTPTMINAVFNHRNFFDGRAQSEFNGVTPFGMRDPDARVWMLTGAGPQQVRVIIDNASLASQAVGPPLNSTEMSAGRRKFQDIGYKLLRAKPLALQHVDPNDSVLGTLADTATGKGLNVTYASLIQKAFQPKWWNWNYKMPMTPYNMMESNFSFYWGLAIMMYESTLVADNSPMDQYLETRFWDPFQFDIAGVPLMTSHDPTLLDPVVARMAAKGVTITRDDILKGLALFERPVAPPPSYPVPTTNFGAGCMFCHMGAETTSASIRNLAGPGLEVGDVVLKNAGFDLKMERMFMKMDWNPPGALSPVPAGTNAITFDPSNYQVDVVNGPNLPTATYDVGWYNLGVRPSSEDAGLGAHDPFGLPLSWTQLNQLIAPNAVNVAGNSLGCVGAGNVNFPNVLVNPLGFPLLSGPLHATDATAVDGSFKVPGLRNVELTGPYFHNGGKSTLMQVLEFYDEGGDFGNTSKAPGIVNLHLTQDQRRSLVAFLTALTDERVLYEKAPFDHPELILPNGQDETGLDIANTLPAVGNGGSATPLQQFLNLSPFEN